MSTLELPGLGQPTGLLLLADGTRLVTPAGLLVTLAGDEQEEAGFEEGKGANASFCLPAGMTVDTAGHIVVADCGNNALRRVSKAGEVSTLACNGEEGFVDGQGEANPCPIQT